LIENQGLLRKWFFVNFGLLACFCSF